MFKTGRILLILSLCVLSHSAVAKTTLLKLDDGSQESKRSITGAGHAVRFECPDDEKWFIRSVAIHGSRYGTPAPPDEDFQVIIASDDLSRRQEIKKPYSLFKRGREEWVRFGVEPIEVQGAFHVAAFFNPTRTKGVYVGIDSDASPTHSSTILSSAPDKKESDIEGEWMIRVYLTKDYDGEASTLLDATGLADKRRQDESARDDAILGDARSLTLKRDTGAMDKHMNIQGALYTVEFETPKNVEGYVWQVQAYASQFGAKHDSEAVSGDVYILDEDRQVITRTTFPYSVATQQKQWLTLPTLPTKVQGKFYVSINAHGGQYKGLYLGYQDGNKEGLASTDELKEGRVQPAEWSKKFEHMQWMIRVKIADRPVVY